ncbi:MAG: thioredoxin [Isosphaeraceae bacterium]|nr:thioredoxin [Isosphaeraceae bacterium]
MNRCHCKRSLGICSASFLFQLVAIVQSGRAADITGQATALLENIKSREALALLEKTDSPAEDDGAYRVLLGRALLGNGRHADAERVLSVAGHPAHEPQRLATLARIAEERGKLDDALEKLSKAVDARRSALESVESVEGASALAEYTTLLGELALRAGRVDQAKAEFQKAVALVGAAHAKLHELGIPHSENDPRMFAGGAVAGLARIYALEGDDRRAERGLRSLATRVDDPRILLMAAGHFLVKDDAQNAKRFLDRALQLTAGKPGHRRTRALLLASRVESRDEALSLAEATFEDSPDTTSRDVLAWVLHLRGDDARAWEILRPVIELGSQDAMILFHAGTISQSFGKPEEAKALLARALRFSSALDPVAVREARRALEQLQ